MLVALPKKYGLVVQSRQQKRFPVDGFTFFSRRCGGVGEVCREQSPSLVVKRTAKNDVYDAEVCRAIQGGLHRKWCVDGGAELKPHFERTVSGVFGRDECGVEEPPKQCVGCDHI